MKKILKWVGIIFIALIVFSVLIPSSENKPVTVVDAPKADNIVENESKNANEAATTESVTTLVQETTSQPETKGESLAQKNAIKAAKNYLSFSAFSRSGLISQLEFEGYSTEDSSYALDQINIDWKEQATKAAKNYLSFSAFSKSGLIEQLEFEGYSTEDATYGVGQISVDWNEQAAKAAKNYLSFSPFSRSGLIEQLGFEGYSNQEAIYGVDKVGL